MPSNPGGPQKLRLVTAILLTVLIGSCVDSSAPNPPSTAATPGIDAAIQAVPTHGIDAEFTRIAKQVPGFGGMYYDRSGRLNVYMTKSAAGQAARSADVVARLRSLGGAAVQRRLGGAAVTTVEAKYDYLQLQGWKSRLGKVFKVKGVVFTDIDEAANRLRIAITPAAALGEVKQVLVAAGVPAAAVTFTRMPEIRNLQTIQDKLRPVPGAAQIVFPAPSEGKNAFFVCSIGFNAKLAGQANKKFFVTASHCSDIQGGNQHTPYYQPVPTLRNLSVNKIAVEFRDPQYGNPGGLCFEGFRCRLSDALLAEYQGSVGQDFGKIARTTFGLQRIGSLIIDPKHPRWNIVGEFSFPFLGEEAHKVGRTSGWTHGPVIATCVDVQASGTDIIELCQDIVLAGSRGGDSGSGVFERASASTSDIFLTGILWGGGTDDTGAPIFVFGSMENIRFELGGQLITSP